MKKIFLLFIPLLLAFSSFSQFTVTIQNGPIIEICPGNVVELFAIPDTTNIISYQWNTGETTDYIYVSEAGEYIVTVTDDKQAVAKDTITVIVAPTPQINLINIPTDVCFGGPDVVLTPDSNQGYFYGDNVINTIFSPMYKAGENFITYEVMYGMECMHRENFIINVNEVTADVKKVLPSGCNNSNGEITYSPTANAFKPYSYLWQNGDTTSTIKNLEAGFYEVTITDALGCTEVFSTDLYGTNMQPTARIEVLNKETVKEAPFTLFLKNKSENYCYASWNISSNNIYMFSEEKEPSFVLTVPGTYNISLDVSSGGEGYDYTSTTVTIVEPTPDTTLIGKCDDFKIELDTKHNICAGNKKGEITANVSGGVEPYRYFWSTTRTDNKINKLKAGMYAVTVTDFQGCKKTVTAEVLDSSQMYMLDIKATLPTSCTATDGSINIIITGGTAPYTYLWNNSISEQNLTNASAGTQTFKATDANGCIYNYSTNLIPSDAPSGFISNVNSTNCTEPKGSVGVYMDDTDNITISWSDMDSDEHTTSRNNLTPGEYTMFALDTISKCVTTLKAVVEAEIPERQEICIVTVSPETGKNLVVWEPVQLKDKVDYYSIYKEDKNTKEYEVIATVPSDQISVFRDDDSDPKNTSERYKISATNHCGIESELSYEHKTIHLQSEFGIKEYVELIQDFYEGHYVYTYKLWANTKLGYSYPIGSYNSQSKECWINKLVPDASIIRYYMTMEVESPCTPFAQNGLKEESGPFSLAMSNIAEAETTDINDINELRLSVSPNPSQGIITIQIPENGELAIYTIDGKMIISENVTTGEQSYTSFTKGIYMVKLQGDKSYYSTFVVE